jgi:transmembrane sensor
VAASLSVVAAVLFLILRPAPAPSAEVATLTLADGSRIRQNHDARLSVTTQEPTLVEISQTSGSAEYEVSPNPSRTFVVRAPGVTLKVLGTIFAVEVGQSGVHVRVMRGRVSVDDGARHVVLGAGEEWRLVATRGPPVNEPSLPVPVVAPPIDSSEILEEAGSPPATVEETPEAMLRRADSLRAGGNLGEAATVLETFLARYPRDRRVTAATFTLARVERSRGRHARAAELFRSVARGTLAEDALAEEAASWQSAGRTGDAKAAAQRYLDRFPQGTHAERMQRIVK